MIRLPVISLAMLSAAALAYELLLMRLFSIIHWHHFAYMVIGLAVLGHAFSGSVVMVLQDRLNKHFRQVYIACILFFSLFSMISFQWAQHVPFNAEEILWDWRQSIYLLMIFLLLSLPFFFVGAICIAFLSFKQRLARLYAADLLGAGVGCLGFVVLMFGVFPKAALFYISLSGLIVAVVAGLELQIARSYLTGFIVIILAVLCWNGWHLQLQISPYKSLPQMLQIKGTHVIAKHSSPLGMISVLASDHIPLRYVPGMSLSSGSEPLSQLGVFTDADNMSVITRSTDDLQQLDYLDQLTSALPYHLHAADKVLIIGSGTGTDVLQAQFHHAGQTDAVELNKQVVNLTNMRYRDFVSDVYHQPGVRVHIADGRDFLNTHNQQYDLIQLTLLDSFNASVSGLYALNESYLYTVEAMQLYRYHRVFAYFCAIGLGFMMIEIAFMQKFILFLHHSVYAAAATLSAFLVFAGVGSACTRSLTKYYGLNLCVAMAIFCIVGLSLGYLVIFPDIFVWGSALSMPLRFVVTICLISPLAFFMGMPMPLALGSLAEQTGYLIPWAWGINGSASVISSVLAVLLAMQFGFSMVILVAVTLYILAVFMFPRPKVAPRLDDYLFPPPFA